MTHRTSLLVIAVALVIAAVPFGRAQTDDIKLNPTLSKASPTGVAIPKDLDAAIAELDKMLPQGTKDKMRAGSEDNMAEYHLSLGMWMRNNWGLWKGLTLAKWFSQHDIHHPDDMSGIILTSYWRHLNGKPIHLEEQVREYKAYWEQALKDAAKEKLRAAAARQKLRQMMAGTRVVPSKTAILRLPSISDLSFRVRYVAPFRDGVLMTAKRFEGDSYKTKPGYVIRTFLLNLKDRQLHKVTTDIGGTVEDSVVIGKDAYLNCVSLSGGRILHLAPKEHSVIPWPWFATESKRPIRLGIERNEDGQATGLLAVGEHKVARWIHGAWTILPFNGFTLPECILPAELRPDRLVFRDEGQNEDDKRLYWIDRTKPSKLFQFEENVGVVGTEGPRWENVWDYARTKQGDWWISTGPDISENSLLQWSPKAGYKVALLFGQPKWIPELLPIEHSDEKGLNAQTSITGLELGSGGELRGVGPVGLYTIRRDRIEQTLRFTTIPKDWIPTKLLTVSPTVQLVGGQYGGLFLLERTHGSAHAIELDSRMGRPVALP